MSGAPCKNCPDRKPRCHTVCEKYIAFKEQARAEQKAKHNESEIDSYETRRSKRLFNRKRSKK